MQQEDFEVTWPYLSKEVDAALQPHLIERHAQEILARAAVHGRLVAFVGAGVSMSYGRLSWYDLVFEVLKEVASIDPLRLGSHPHIQAEISSRLHMLEHNLGLLQRSDNKLVAQRSALNALGEGNPLLILQLCTDALRLARDGESLLSAQTTTRTSPNEQLSKRPRTLDEIYQQALKSPELHDKALIEALRHWLNDRAGGRAWGGLAMQAALKRLAKVDRSAFAGRRHFLQWLVRLDMSGGSAEDVEPRKRSLHDNGSGSPLSLLLHEFGVQRFATTNYDKEIEGALREGMRRDCSLPLGRTAASLTTAGLPADLQFRTLSLHRETATSALAFALEGRRRHSQVLHLHGHIDEPQRLIASERDYQVQYLGPNKQRDLLDNAIRALFGANPVLYVGSGISEDDVLRPLRELMSSAPRRPDRLGVALLPASKEEAKLALHKIECRVRYGIHVIHYGYDQCPRCRKEPRGKSWLRRFTEAVGQLKDCLNDPAGPSAVHIKVPRAPKVMEGQGCDHRNSAVGTSLLPPEFAIDHELDLMEAMVEDLKGPREQRLPEGIRTGQLQLLDEITTSIVSAFLCARLKTEAEFRARWARQTTRPLEPVRTAEPIRLTQEADEPPQTTYRHMTLDVGQYRGGQAYRFGAESRELDQRWPHLLASLRRHGNFVRNPRRRIVLLPVQRGAGKGSMFDQLAAENSKELEALKVALTPQIWPGPLLSPLSWRAALVSLNFLSDVTNLADCIARVIWPVELQGGAELLADNVYGRMEQALEACSAHHRSTTGCDQRVLLALANVGVLFDSKGDAKNGQVLRLLRLLTDPRFSDAPIDFVVFCDEAHVPRRFRLSFDPDGSASSDGVRPGRPLRPTASMAELRSEEPRARYEHPQRLMLRGIRAEDRYSNWLHVHTPARNHAWIVAHPFLGRWLDKRNDKTVPVPGLEEAVIDLHRRLGGSRIALTLVLALCHEQCGLAFPDKGRPDPSATLLLTVQEAATAMAIHIHESAPETAIHHVFDGWAVLHLRRADLLSAPDVERLLRGDVRKADQISKLLKQANSAGHLWRLTQEILWHLSVFSHPVELSVLCACPGVETCAKEWIGPQAAASSGEPVTTQDLIEAVTELCVFRCLAMRMMPRQLGRRVGDDAPRRYTVHRMVQRYFIRMMGGRNIEAIEWDQFTTSLYTSQPDELPALSTDAHGRIKGLIAALSRYGRSQLLHPDDDLVPQGRSAEEEFQALRAAYFVARSTYSVGVLSHIAAQPHLESPEFGHMEEYRRLIRWITHRAQMLEGPLQEQTDSQRRDARRYEGGFFHRGEIVWLYAECGVMSLTQGKLEDAELLLNLALRAARRIECDDTGSLHVRLLLHVALVHIERGRPRAAKRLLEPIAARRDGHEMPPLIADFYLGMIDHMGGEYHSASHRYERTLKRFRDLKRTRSAAFVLKSLADLLVARDPSKVAEAESLAQEAIAVAARGGHEDVRMLAILAQVRISTKAKGSLAPADAYRQLELVEKYGVDMGMPRIQAAAHEVRALLLASQGETTQSVDEATHSAEIAALYDLKLFKCKALLTLARVLTMRGEAQQARSAITMGLEMAHAAEYFSCVRGFRALELQWGQAIGPA